MPTIIRVRSVSKKFTPYDKKCGVCGDVFMISKPSMAHREHCGQPCVGIGRRVNFTQL